MTGFIQQFCMIQARKRYTEQNVKYPGIDKHGLGRAGLKVNRSINFLECKCSSLLMFSIV